MCHLSHLEEGTATSHTGRRLDWKASGAKCRSAVHEGTDSLTVLDKDVLGTGWLDLIFHLLDNFG